MILDIAFACVMILCIYFGFKRGFVRSVCNVSSYLLSVIVAFLSYDKITEFVATSPVGEFISEKVSGTVNIGEIDLSSVPELLKKPLEAGVAASNNAVSTLSQNFTNVIIGIISVIITIILVKIGLKFIFKVFNVFAKLPVLKQCNGLLGGAFGVVSGCFWICIAVFALTYISMLPSVAFLKEITEASKIAKLVAENNFLTMIIPG